MKRSRAPLSEPLNKHGTAAHSQPCNLSHAYASGKSAKQERGLLR